MSLRILKNYIKKNGKAKTAVALDLTETSAINNWIARKIIPESKKIAVRELVYKEVSICYKKPQATLTSACK